MAGFRDSEPCPGSRVHHRGIRATDREPGARLLLDRLAAARRRDFIGRRRELALFLDTLHSGSGAAIYLHGPGGIGKSSLLRQYGWIGAERGRRVIRFDATLAGRSAGAVLAGLAEAAGAGDDDPRAVLLRTPALLLLVDGADAFGPLERWVREDVLAGLPEDAVVVLAGRNPPGLDWITDPGWRSVLHPVRLRELDPGESRELLRRRGLPEPACDAAISFARGHPLALALAAEIGAELPGRVGTTVPEPQVLRDLLSGLLDAVPGPLYRAALEASSQVLVTTEPLLGVLLGEPDAHEVFGWLRALSVMEYADRGVRPHDLVRDLLDAELRWRDPDRHAEIRRRAAGYYRARLRSAEPVLPDLAYLHRDSPVLGPFLSWVAPGDAVAISGEPGAGPGVGALAVTPMTAGEWPRLRRMLVRHEGEESARLGDAWCSPATVLVVRAAGGEPAGFVLLLALESIDPGTRSRDPATAAAWRYLSGSAPLAAGASALYVRFWLAERVYQEVSPVQTAMTLHLVRHYLTTPNLAVNFLPVADPEFWAAPLAHAGLDRRPEADFSVGGHRYGVFAHDWRVVPPAAWLDSLAGDGTGTHPAATPSLATAIDPAAPASEEEFLAEVRVVLRELGRPDRLADSRLARSALARSSPNGLEGVIRDAAAVLENSARDRRAYRALHHTYLAPAGTQQRAADLLDLPMSTYRRHLDQGVRRLTAILWRRELAARSAPRPGNGSAKDPIEPIAGREPPG